MLRNIQSYPTPILYVGIGGGPTAVGDGFVAGIQMLVAVILNPILLIEPLETGVVGAVSLFSAAVNGPVNTNIVDDGIANVSLTNSVVIVEQDLNETDVGIAQVSLANTVIVAQETISISDAGKANVALTFSN